MTSREIYQKKRHSSLEGLHVVICNRDKSDCNTKFAKGMYGFVRSVDVEMQTAQVEYQASETRIPLRNLISL